MVKDIAYTIDIKIQLIKGNYKADVNKELIEKTNFKIIKNLKSLIKELKRISCDKNLIENYTKKVKKTEKEFEKWRLQK